MNNGLKALLIAASTIITCMIVSLGFRLANSAGQIGNRVNAEMEQYKTTLQERNITKYDNAVVYGADILNLIQMELPTKADFFRVTAHTDNGSYVFTAKGDIDYARKVLVKTDIFKGAVLRNANGVIEEVRFSLQQENKE